MSKSEEWQVSRFSREAFGPAQLREGAKSTGGIGGCPFAGFGFLTPNDLRTCASRQFAQQGWPEAQGGGVTGKTESTHNAVARLQSSFVPHVM